MIISNKHFTTMHLLLGEKPIVFSFISAKIDDSIHKVSVKIHQDKVHTIIVIICYLSFI